MMQFNVIIKVLHLGIHNCQREAYGLQADFVIVLKVFRVYLLDNWTRLDETCQLGRGMGLASLQGPREMGQNLPRFFVRNTIPPTGLFTSALPISRKFGRNTRM